MRTTTVNKVNEWITWWNWHASTMDNSSVENKVAFLAKAMQGSLELITLLTEEIREVEYGRETTKKIVLPVGIAFHERMRAAGNE